MLLVFSTQAVLAKTVNVTELDVQRASKLRMLAQRTAKLSLQIQLGVKVGDANVKLQDSVKQFDKLLIELKRLEENEKITSALNAVSYNWDELKNQLPKNNPDLVNQSSEELTLSVLRISKLLESEEGTNIGRLVSLAVQESTLSQRMAKLYFLHCLGRQKKQEVQVTRERFSLTFDALINATENSTRAKDLLLVAKNQWLFYELALKAPDRKDPAFLENVATTSERITEVMENVLAEYGKTAK